MDHFSIVLGLCRSAMQSPNEAIRNHIDRLIKALQKEGSAEQVKALEKLLVAERAAAEMTPSRVVLSRAALYGELLTPNVHPPVDKETGAPLAEIVHLAPEEVNGPVFQRDLAAGVEALLEEWRHVDALKAAGVNPALTTMFFGAPGTGKTMLAHYIASQLGLPLIVARLDGLISSFLGTTARNISTLFSFANRYKCVLLLDEFDAVAKLRDDPHELGEVKRVVNTLLQCIDTRAKSGFTIAITNHESLLDPAVWRRFDIRIHVPKPDISTRLSIAKANFSDRSEDEPYVKFIAWVTEEQSGSDIEKLSEFIKRQKALKPEGFSVFEAVKQYVRLSASEKETVHRQLLNREQDELAITLFRDKHAPFSQEQLAMLLNCTQSTISRMIKKRKSVQGE